jgi:hypothetical protein
VILERGQLLDIMAARLGHSDAKNSVAYRTFLAAMLAGLDDSGGANFGDGG